MSIILWVAMIGYLTVAIVFNLAMLSYYQEDKYTDDSLWTDSDFCNKLGIFLCSAFWPLPVIWGVFKMKKEESK